jgi:DNA ligase-1
VQWKLDGIRIQVHRGEGAPDGGPGPVTIVTRNLHDITGQLPGVVEQVRRLTCDSIVLDGELLGLRSADPDGGDEALGSPVVAEAGAGLSAHFFDVLYLDGESLIDRPLLERLDELEGVCGEASVSSIVTDDVAEARTHLDQALAAGHEGVMVKGVDSRYEAGRRGKAWRKVKPVYTLDLVVLGAEWGHGRRQGWLSNLHLGALDPDTGQPVMVGKTFKGLTDELLAWQTAELSARKTSEQGITVMVRPELVVEIALDSAHPSTRYPGGVALRFARVRRYRPDKDAAAADTLDAVRRLVPGQDR